jgi:hypothetical protein
MINMETKPLKLRPRFLSSQNGFLRLGSCLHETVAYEYNKEIAPFRGTRAGAEEPGSKRVIKMSR